MAERFPLQRSTHDRLVAAIADLVGTQTDEQVIVQPVGAGPGTLDLAHLDEGDGGRWFVYVELPPGRPLHERGLPFPDGSEIVDDDGATATIELGELSPAGAALVLEAWAQRLFGHEATWLATADA